jgi:hypothetical protein
MKIRLSDLAELQFFISGVKVEDLEQLHRYVVFGIFRCRCGMKLVMLHDAESAPLQVLGLAGRLHPWIDILNLPSLIHVCLCPHICFPR